MKRIFSSLLLLSALPCFAGSEKSVSGFVVGMSTGFSVGSYDASFAKSGGASSSSSSSSSSSGNSHLFSGPNSFPLGVMIGGGADLGGFYLGGQVSYDYAFNLGGGVKKTGTELSAVPNALAVFSSMDDDHYAKTTFGFNHKLAALVHLGFVPIDGLVAYFGAGVSYQIGEATLNFFDKDGKTLNDGKDDYAANLSGLGPQFALGAQYQIFGGLGFGVEVNYTFFKPDAKLKDEKKKPDCADGIKRGLEENRVHDIGVRASVFYRF